MKDFSILDDLIIVSITEVANYQMVICKINTIKSISYQIQENTQMDSVFCQPQYMQCNCIGTFMGNCMTYFILVSCFTT